MIRNERSPLSPSIALALSVCLALLAAGCGQRGPLYLPDEEQTEQEVHTKASPEEDQEEIDEENS